jgi:hypothetical protein
MSSAQTKATRRMVVASFAAGAGAMLLLGLVAPVAMQGGLTVRDAFASEVQTNEALIQPLDVQAIEAQLAEADRLMGETRAETDDDMARLERLSGR